MKRAALALVLVACSASSNDFPPLAEGGGPPGSSGGGGGTVRDAGTGDGGASGGLIQGRVCIVKDLSNPTVCDTTKDASVVKVTLGTRMPAVGPDHDGVFMIAAPVGRPVWRATSTGNIFVPSVMPWTTETTIPIVPELLFNDATGMSGVAPIAAGQGSVVARVVNGVSPVPAATNLTSIGVTAVPLYATNNGLVWTTTGPTLASGAVWFPGVDVTSVPGRTITLTPQGGAQVITPVDVVEDQAITFVTQDLR